MNHIYGVNKYTYARYCTETDIFLKTTRAGPGSGFGGEISRSGKKVRIRIRNTALQTVTTVDSVMKELAQKPSLT